MLKSTEPHIPCIHAVRTFLIDRNALVVSLSLTVSPNVSEYTLLR